jgi:tetratricopeptide (TPR) repeat protein
MMNDEDPIKEKAKEYLQKAYRLQMSGHLNEAIENYKASLELVDTAECRTFYGWALSFLGEYDKAIEQCQRAIEIDPDFGNPYNDIGAYYIQKMELDLAVPYLKQAMEAKRYATPHFPHYNYGRVLERKGDWFGARDEYRTANKMEPHYTLAKDALSRITALLN